MRYTGDTQATHVHSAYTLWPSFAPSICVRHCIHTVKSIITQRTSVIMDSNFLTPKIYLQLRLISKPMPRFTRSSGTQDPKFKNRPRDPDHTHFGWFIAEAVECGLAKVG